jgi:hypothetical protein
MRKHMHFYLVCVLTECSIVCLNHNDYLSFLWHISSLFFYAIFTLILLTCSAITFDSSMSPSSIYTMFSFISVSYTSSSLPSSFSSFLLLQFPSIFSLIFSPTFSLTLSLLFFFFSSFLLSSLPPISHHRRHLCDQPAAARHQSVRPLRILRHTRFRILNPTARVRFVALLYLFYAILDGSWYVVIVYSGNIMRSILSISSSYDF